MIQAWAASVHQMEDPSDSPSKAGPVADQSPDKSCLPGDKVGSDSTRPSVSEPIHPLGGLRWASDFVVPHDGLDRSVGEECGQLGWGHAPDLGSVRSHDATKQMRVKTPFAGSGCVCARFVHMRTKGCAISKDLI
jgi:hypothetical protein